MKKLPKNRGNYGKNENEKWRWPANQTPAAAFRVPWVLKMGARYFFKGASALEKLSAGHRHLCLAQFELEISAINMKIFLEKRPKITSKECENFGKFGLQFTVFCIRFCRYFCFIFCNVFTTFLATFLVTFFV